MSGRDRVSESERLPIVYNNDMNKYVKIIRFSPKRTRVRKWETIGNKLYHNDGKTAKSLGTTHQLFTRRVVNICGFHNDISATPMSFLIKPLYWWVHARHFTICEESTLGVQYMCTLFSDNNNNFTSLIVD